MNIFLFIILCQKFKNKILVDKVEIFINFMLVKRLASLTPLTSPLYSFGVDAKQILIGVPKEVHQN